MAKAWKPESKFRQPADYGELLAGHDVPLGIAAVKAATSACRSGKTHAAAQPANWSKGLTTRH